MLLDRTPLFASPKFAYAHTYLHAHLYLRRCSPSHIYILTSEEQKVEDAVEHFEWKTVGEVLQGKQTIMFARQRAADIMDTKVLSVIHGTDNR